MEFTPALWLILGLTLVLGWVLGLMSRSGGGKWKRELKTERERHALELKERDTRIEAANARIADMERARPATAYRTDEEAHDHRGDLRHRESSLDNLDLTRGRDDGRERVMIRPTRP
jgi:hypothetical protein